MELERQTFQRNVDEDGYLELPDYVLDDYGNAYVSLGFGVYLHLMGEKVWLEFEAGFRDRMKQVTILDEDTADLADRLYAFATRLDRDSLGRVQIPKDLLDAAKIHNRVVGVYLAPLGYWRLWAWEIYCERKQAH